MTDTSATHLASLLCSRLCHDLLSPVGALSNGLELLQGENNPEMRQSFFELLEQSARISADKLRFFRLAYGAAGGFGEMVEVAEAKSLVEALASDNEKLAITWQLSADILPKEAVKVLLNFAHIALDALIRGGSLEIAAEMRNGASEIAVRAAGEKIAFDETVGKALDGTLPDGELSSRTAPARMIGMLAEELGGGLQYALSKEALVLGAVLPQSDDGMIG